MVKGNAILRVVVALVVFGIDLLAAEDFYRLKWYPSKSAMACELSFPVPVSRKDFPRLEVCDAAGKRVWEGAVPSSQTNYVVTQEKPPRMVVHEAVRLASEGEWLPDGEYHAILRAGDAKRVLCEKDFRMKRYEWFGSDAGRHDILLPGFSRLVAKGRSVEAVGRKYLFGADGLPKRIWSLGEEILARPVAVKCGAAETPVEGVGASFEILSQTDTAVAFQGTLASGRVEQDGLVVLDLELPETMDEVYMEIPLKAEYALLFHACSDGIRANPAGFLPAGEGRVFGSGEVKKWHYKGDFIPYCWIGTDTRGICFAADNDRGWEHGASHDAVELHREADGTVVMRLSLICGGGWHAPRRITVALQASPVKPMPHGWRGWVDAYDVPAERNTLCNCSNPTWGSYTCGMARYPTFMDFRYVRKMCEAARTGRVDEAFLEAWIERCWQARTEHPELVQWLANKDEAEAKKTLRAHAYAGFRRPCFLSHVKNPVFYYYTCNNDPCDGLYEYPVMADEWGKYAMVMGSHQNYAVFYLKKMCEAGMTGVYDDNTFLQCNYDWVTGDAWIDSQGVVHPSFLLWSNREYCRRQIVAMLEAGVREPWLTIHHTNANVLPTFSFATNTMGMEWKYGNSDFQERYSPDYIRTVNQGLQMGCFPTSLEGIFEVTDSVQKTWVTRTMLAALLPHEVQPTLSELGDHKLVVKALSIKQKFGVGRDDCVYTAYWDPANPLVQTRKDVLASVYRRGSQMLVVIGSYADEDVEMTLLLKEGAFLSAINAETGRPLPCADGVVRLPLKRHDFAMLLAACAP